MKRLLTFVFGLVFALAAPASAQQELVSSCSTVQGQANGYSAPAEVNNQFRFLCGQVVSALTNVQPTVGIGFSGGSHTLGTMTTIGRRLGLFPRVSATARFNLALAEIPNVLEGFDARLDEDGNVPPMGVVRLPVGSLQGDVVLGLYNGISLGPLIGGVGSVDLLGSMSVIPALQVVSDRIGMDEHIINVGLGARVGLIRQGLLMPGVSVSGMYRTMLGDVGFGDMLNPDPAAFSTSLSTLSFRGGVSKGLLMINLAAGAGYDIYTSDVTFDWRLICPADQCGGQERVLRPTAPVEGQLQTAAWNVFGNVGLNLLLLNIVGEVGYQKATDIVDLDALRDPSNPDQMPTTEAIEGGRFFLSIGARLTI